MSKTSKVSPMKLKGRPGFLVQTPFDDFFVEQLREMIPKRDRWFNRPRKGWWISEEHLEIVLHLVRDAFGGAITVVDEDGREITHEGDDRIEQGRLL